MIATINSQGWNVEIDTSDARLHVLSASCNKCGAVIRAERPQMWVPSLREHERECDER
jgi:exosome complex RNA-binding protein Csl4